MKHKLYLVFTLFTIVCSAQQPNWGWGLPITVTGSSSITCTVTDPVNGTETHTQSGISSYIYSDGVVAYVTPGGTVGGIIYDVNTHRFEYTTFSSNSGNTISNDDGVIAWVSSAGTVGGATYDPTKRRWEYTTFSSNSGNTVINRHGVVAWVSSAGTVGGAVYDPYNGNWEYTTFSSNAGNTIINTHGVIGYVSTAGTVGGAVYDPATNDWEYTTFSSNSGNEIDNNNGVIAYLSTAGTVGGAAYDFNSHNWDYTTLSSNSNNTNLSVEDGTVTWSNNNGSQKAGYSSSGSWNTGNNTNLQCRFFIEQPSNSNNLAYFWCLSIGANNYSYDSDAGHTISRRWGWKQYSNGGDYYPSLTISNSNSNSQCNNSVSFTTDIKELLRDRISVYPSPTSNTLHLDGHGLSITTIEIVDATGKVVTSNNSFSYTTAINVSSLNNGVYFLYATTNDGSKAVTRFVKQ